VARISLVRGTERDTGSGNLAALASVACTSQSRCFAVGNYRPVNNAYGDETRVLVESDGKQGWSSVIVQGGAEGQSALQSISCVALTRCVAVGSAPQSAYGVDGGLVMTWSGSAWMPLAANLPDLTLESVACVSTHVCVGRWRKRGWHQGGRSLAGSGERAQPDVVACVMPTQLEPGKLGRGSGAADPAHGFRSPVHRLRQEPFQRPPSAAASRMTGCSILSGGRGSCGGAGSSPPRRCLRRCRPRSFVCGRCCGTC